MSNNRNRLLHYLILTIMMCSLPCIQCIERQWENPFDPANKNIWIKFADSPEKYLADTDNYFLFYINNKMLFLSAGPANVIYRFLNPDAGWAKDLISPSGGKCVDAIEFNNQIYVLSGSQGVIDFSLTYYDPGTNQFSNSVDLEKTNAALECLVATESRLFAFESDTAGGGKTVLHEIDPSTGALSLITTLPSMRTGFGKAAVNDEIYVIGGSVYKGGKTDGEWTNAVDSYKLKSDTWLHADTFPAMNDKFACTVIGDRIYVFNIMRAEIFEFAATERIWSKKYSHERLMRGSRMNVAPYGKSMLVWGGFLMQTTVYEVYIYHVEYAYTIK